jgi:hypothetical protein
LLALVRANACLQFSHSQTSSIQSFASRAFCTALHRKRFGPFTRAIRGFTPIILLKGQPLARYSAACRS